MAIPVYLWLTDDTGNAVKGEVDINGRENSIEILEFMHSVDLPTNDLTGTISGSCIHCDYSFIKETDRSSPYLLQAVSTGRKFKKAEFRFYKINDNGQEVEYFRTTLEHARATNIEPLMMDVKDSAYFRHNHLEAVHLRYEKITWHYLDGNIVHSDSWKGRGAA